MAGDPVTYLESSFLSPLLKEESVTDISYNGTDIFYVSNFFGRQKSTILVNKEEVSSFLRQLANLTEQQFTVQSPILDVSFGKYRLNAVNSSLARNQNKKTYTFSVRIESGECRINKDSSFFEKESLEILLDLLSRQESIVIGGKTSSGKTELEKWLLLNMNINSRVIVIDNVEELDMIENPLVDLSTWLVNEKVNYASFSRLIRNALRNNPDYIVIAESRGEEMLDALVSTMSGHPIITTIHAKDLESMPDRIARLAMLSGNKLLKDELMEDISHHMRYYVYVAKSCDKVGKISRYIKSIGRIDEASMKMEVLYERKENDE